MTEPFRFTNPQPVAPASAPSPKRHRLLKAAGVFAVFALGVALGTAPGGAARAAAGPAAAVPAQTVTATATATATQTKTVSEVPAECKLALDEADKLTIIFRDTMNIVSDVLYAASRYDVKTINAAIPKMDEQTKKINSNLYPTYRDRCRGYVK